MLFSIFLVDGPTSPGTAVHLASLRIRLFKDIGFSSSNDRQRQCPRRRLTSWHSVKSVEAPYAVFVARRGCQGNLIARVSFHQLRVSALWLEYLTHGFRPSERAAFSYPPQSGKKKVTSYLYLMECAVNPDTGNPIAAAAASAVKCRSGSRANVRMAGKEKVFLFRERRRSSMTREQSFVFPPISYRDK